MSMTTKSKKRKFPVNREVKSRSVQNGLVSFNHHTTDPGTVVSIKGALSDEAKADLLAAIDEVLAFHLL